MADHNEELTTAEKLMYIERAMQGTNTPKPEPTPWDNLIEHRRDVHMWCVWCTKYEKAALAAIEQTKPEPHVHERGAYTTPESDVDLRCQHCGMIQNLDWWRIYDRGVADARRQG